jgi:16S rRNA (cytosine967-C5)-methyltransferase
MIPNSPAAPPATGAEASLDAAGARATAARIVALVMHEGRLLDRVLEKALPAAPPGLAPLIQEMAYGTLRFAPRLQMLSARLLKRPLRDKDVDVGALLLIGLYQLLYMHVQDYAAVSCTVDAATALDKPWAKELVNACLRRFLREKETLLAEIATDPVARHSHPLWLLEALRQAWPAYWQALVQANNERPPLALRVNLLKSTREQYLQRLQTAGLAATALPRTDSGVVLQKPVPVSVLPGFSEGVVSIQDGAAQLAAALLDMEPGQRVLDACAAPGGKLCHLLERLPENARVVALDKEPARVPLIHQNLRRLGLAAEVVLGDATDPAGWWDGRPFERVLLDAPCSATGVIRRHPDVKLHRTPSEVHKLRRLQAAILQGLWPLLTSGGKLLYMTCSVLPGENEQQLQAFLARHSDASVVPLSLPFALARDPGLQILPGEQGMDGFYYACLRKS